MKPTENHEFRLITETVGIPANNSQKCLLFHILQANEKIFQLAE